MQTLIDSRPPPEIEAARAAPATLIEWRRVLGSFQLSIPIGTRHAVLGPEERLFSVLRWIGQ